MRYIVTALVVFLFVGIIVPLYTSASTTYATGHGCAQPVPPGISGNPSPAPAASGVILMNEVLLTPHSTWNCSENGTYFTTTDSWLELYNTQNQPYNLYAAHAAIADTTNTSMYFMPFGTSIAAHGYLVLFPYTDALFKETTTPTLKLIVNNVVVDQIAVPLLGPDQSYARTSDGASAWQTNAQPTIDASNALSPTPTPTLGKSSGGGSSSGGGTITPTSNPTQVLVSGKQPQWNALHFPATATVTTTLLSSPSSTATTINDAAFDTPRRLLLSIFVIAFALTLFWCWWLFKSS